MSELLDRLIKRDATLWPEGNVSQDRLGWLEIAETMRANAAEISEWARTVTQSTVVLIGMGGSSLGPEVLRAAVEDQRLVVLDTTDPATVSSVDPANSFFLVASKSGGTLEVQSLLAYFWDLVPDGSRYAAITDPDTLLEQQATERKFSKIFTNPADIGGRYSALSYFGLVPAGLLGYDVDAFCAAASSVDKEEAVQLGVAMAEAFKQGRDKVTVVSQPGRFSAFGLWVEQLIAESTGKSGRGLVPVPTTEQEDGADRFVTKVDISEPNDLAREFYRWEIATVIAGSLIEVDPFNEPNVAESKANTKRVLENLPITEPEQGSADSTLEWLKGVVKPGDYVSIQAYLPYSVETELEQLRRRIRDELGGIAVTAGFGPRFLHSTGQLHKGGANNIVSLQLVPAKPTGEVSIPEQDYDFGTLINAQSVGDYQSLRDHGRRVRRVAVTALEEIR